ATRCDAAWYAAGSYPTHCGMCHAHGWGVPAAGAAGTPAVGVDPTADEPTATQPASSNGTSAATRSGRAGAGSAPGPAAETAGVGSATVGGAGAAGAAAGGGTRYGTITGITRGQGTRLPVRFGAWTATRTDRGWCWPPPVRPGSASSRRPAWSPR